MNIRSKARSWTAKQQRLGLRLPQLLGLTLLAITSAHSAPSQSDSTSQRGRVSAAVRRSFGRGFEVAGTRQPYFLTGDFNGDHFGDLAVLVRRKTSGAFPRGVALLNPWEIHRSTRFARGGLALGVIHGGKKGWEGTVLRRFLLTDSEFFTTPIWQDSAQKNLIGLLRHPRATAQGHRLLPRPAKGDAIRVATEAGIDTYLYWDGKTYHLYTPPEEP